MRLNSKIDQRSAELNLNAGFKGRYLAKINKI